MKVECCCFKRLQVAITIATSLGIEQMNARQRIKRKGITSLVSKAYVEHVVSGVISARTVGQRKKTTINDQKIG